MSRLAIVAIVAAAGCGGTESGQAPPWATAGAPATPAAAGAPAATPAPAGAPSAGSQAPVSGQAAAPPENPRAALLRDLKSRKFKNEDFIESETNRDPFHCYLADFSGGATIDTRQYAILFPKYSLDELKLAMIVAPTGRGREKESAEPKSGDDNHPRCDVVACAMFVDSTGEGKAVARGYHISRSDAKVVRIEPEKGQVYVELKEDLGNGKSRVVERVLQVHTSTEGETP